MGCDIHAFAEYSKDNEWFFIKEVFDIRNYALFGFLANVRNYSAVPVLSEPRGLPNNMSIGLQQKWEYWVGDGHTPSWYNLYELTSFDYDQQFEDLRIGKQVTPNFYDGAYQGKPGEGNITTYRDEFHHTYFDDLEELKKIEYPVRIVFWFDN